MKYNDSLFNVSSEYYSKIDSKSIDNINEKTANLEKELLTILLKKFRNILNDKGKKHNGILKINLCTKDEGYTQIKELIKLGKFDSFANEYCLYLGNVELRQNECFEIIWDYRTYFEILSMYEIKNGIQVKEDRNYSQSEMLKAISSFKSLPIKRQLLVLKNFVSKVKKECELEKKELAESECKSKGHRYGRWKRIDYTTYEVNPFLHSRDYVVPEGMEYIDVEHTKWERTCSRCGYVETVFVEPQSLIDARYRKEKQERIKALELELKQLKGK